MRHWLRHGRGCIALLALGLSGAGCAPLAEPPDDAGSATAPAPSYDRDDPEALAPEEYLRAGIPDWQHAWSPQDALTAARALEALTAERPGALPRYRGVRSGALFARMTSPDLVRPCRNARAELQQRMGACELLLQTQDLTFRLYFLPAVQRYMAGRDSSLLVARSDEIIELYGTGLRAVSATAEQLAELGELTRELDPNDPAYKNTAEGLDMIRGGAAQMVLSALVTVRDRDVLQPAQAQRLTEYMLATLPVVFAELAPANRDELYTQLSELAADPEQERLQPALGQLHTRVRSVVEASQQRLGPASPRPEPELVQEQLPGLSLLLPTGFRDDDDRQFERGKLSIQLTQSLATAVEIRWEPGRIDDERVMPRVQKTLEDMLKVKLVRADGDFVVGTRIPSKSLRIGDVAKMGAIALFTAFECTDRVFAVTSRGPSGDIERLHQRMLASISCSTEEPPAAATRAVPAILDLPKGWVRRRSPAGTLDLIGGGSGNISIRLTYAEELLDMTDFMIRITEAAGMTVHREAAFEVAAPEGRRTLIPIDIPGGVSGWETLWPCQSEPATVLIVAGGAKSKVTRDVVLDLLSSSRCAKPDEALPEYPLDAAPATPKKKRD